MDLKTSIRKTLAFFDLFDFPLTAEEILANLYQKNRPIHIREIQGTLNEMEDIEKIHDFYVFKDRGKLVDLRRHRKFLSEKLWNRTRQYMQYVSRVPFVKMVAVCNNLAYDNPSELSDIDLFIVIKKGRMWTTRLIITLILQFFGVRRHGDRIAGRFCLSFFATDDRLDMGALEKKPEDPYLAYWTRHLKPVYGKSCYREFEQANREWLKKRYGLEMPDADSLRLPFSDKSGTRRFWEVLLRGRFGNLLEGLIRRLLRKRSLKKAKLLGPEAGVIIEDTMLKFHNNDRREEYQERWKTRWKTG